MRSYKEALDDFMGSADWRMCSDPDGLMAPPRMRQYIENRLKRAFDAGWNSREALDREAEVLAGSAPASHSE